MLVRLIKILTSLRLTVVCLGCALVLVFFGTLAQVNEGLYLAQNRWFRSFFVWWEPEGGGWRLPLFPGGYLIGTVLLVNLMAAHVKRFQLTWKKLGIHIAHGGIILLLVGQLATDLLSKETQMHFAEGETRDYSESALHNELVFMTDTPNEGEDEVIAVPEAMLKPKQEIQHQKLPFRVRVEKYYPNSVLRQRGPMVDTDPPPSTKGIGTQVVLTPLAETKSMDERNLPTVVIELVAPQGSLGTWLVSTRLTEPQELKLGDKTWRFAFRSERFYSPFSVQLLKTTHEVYRGTDKAKNYQSRVRVENPARHENREVDIYMNNPLRYEGLTFYQYQMNESDPSRRTSILQVVKNPGWLTPYLGCILVAAGLVFQFMIHLVGFIKKRALA
jgi:hypothetical protein